MVKIQKFPQGARVRVKRGDFPLDPAFEGLEGIVVVLHRKQGRRYWVQIDGREGLDAFDESELTPIWSPASIREAGAHQGGSGSDAAS